MKINVLLLLLLIASEALAQVGKQASLIESSEFCWALRYSSDGALTGIADRAAVDDVFLWAYEYGGAMDGMPYIRQNWYFEPSDDYPYSEKPSFFRESYLGSDNLIYKDVNRNNFMWSTGKTFEYSYVDGRMTTFRIEDELTAQLTWTDGNLTGVVFKEGDREVGRMFCTYGNQPAKGICQALTSPLLLLLQYYHVLPLGPLAYDCYGQLNQMLPSEISMTFDDDFVGLHTQGDEESAEYFPFCQRKQLAYSYETNDEGDVTKITANENGKASDIRIAYGDGTLSMHAATDRSLDAPTVVYDLRGRQVDSANCVDYRRLITVQPAGIYVIRCADGRSVKVHR